MAFVDRYKQQPSSFFSNLWKRRADAASARRRRGSGYAEQLQLDWLFLWHVLLLYLCYWLLLCCVLCIGHKMRSSDTLKPPKHRGDFLDVAAVNDSLSRQARLASLLCSSYSLAFSFVHSQFAYLLCRVVVCSVDERTNGEKRNQQLWPKMHYQLQQMAAILKEPKLCRYLINSFQKLGLQIEHSIPLSFSLLSYRYLFFHFTFQKNQIFMSVANFGKPSLKVSKSRMQIVVSSILPKNRTKLTILSNFSTQDSEFRSFFGRIEDTTICFRDLLTFS